MKHYVAYLNTVYTHRRVEVDADNCIEAQHNAARLLDTKREYAIHLIEYQEPRCNLADLAADTTEE